MGAYGIRVTWVLKMLRPFCPWWPTSAKCLPPPTTRSSTPFELSNATNSLKSEVSIVELWVVLAAQFFEGIYAGLHGLGKPIRCVGGLLRRVQAGFLDAAVHGVTLPDICPAPNRDFLTPPLPVRYSLGRPKGLKLR